MDRVYGMACSHAVYGQFVDCKVYIWLVGRDQSKQGVLGDGEGGFDECPGA